MDAVGKGLREELAVRRQDFDALRAIVQELAQAQARTEQAILKLVGEQQRIQLDLADLKGESLERRGSYRL